LMEINGDWESGLILGRDTPWRVFINNPR